MHSDKDKQTKTAKQTIIFVYNADSGMINLIKDFTHKIVSPGTYGCNLCAVTFGSFGMKNEWKTFVDSIEFPVEFLHRDEFFKKYKLKDNMFPAAFLKKRKKVILFIPYTDINRCKTLKDLISLVKKKIKKLSSI